MAAFDDSAVSLDGTWSWFTDPRAVWDSVNSKLYWGEIRSDGIISVESFQNKGTYDLWLQGSPRTTVMEVDDHDNVALVVLDNGEIGCGYSGHGNGAGPGNYFARSNGAGQIKTWNSPVTLNAVSVSYCHLLQLGDSNNTLLYYYRDDADAAKRKLMKSTDRGATWGSAISIIKPYAGGGRPYVKYAQNGSLRVDFIISDDGPGDALSFCSIYAGYMVFSSDGTTQTYFKLDGTQVTSPPFQPDAFTQIYDGSVNFGWIWDIKIIGGNPVYGWVHFTNTNAKHFYHMSRWTGSALVTEQIVEAGDGTADYISSASKTYSPGMALDPNNIDVVYLGIQKTNNASANCEIEKWTHTGTFGSGSFSKTSSISGNTGTVNFRPFTLDCGGTTNVFWCEGVYSTNLSFQTRIRLYPSKTWKKAKPTNPIWRSGAAPAGVKAYYLLAEGSGAPQDLSGNGWNMAVVGSGGTWHGLAAGNYGPYVDSFTASNFFTCNALAAAFNPGTFPWGFILLFKTTSAGGASEWSMSMGNSGDNNPILSLVHSAAAHSFESFNRDNAAAVSDAIASSAGANGGFQNDGEYHTISVRATAANSHQIRIDGAGGMTETTSLGTTTLDRMAMGVLLRAAASGAYSGQEHCLIIFSGALPDRCAIAMQLLRGQFDGTFSLPDVIDVDVASNSGYKAAASSYSWNHTCSGDNRFLAVDVSLLSVPGTTVTGITYNGVAMSFIGAKSTVSGAGRIECWGLMAPAIGTNAIAVSLSATCISAGTAVSYTGVDQTTATEAFNSDQATNVGAADATVNITPIAANAWVHGVVATDDTSITANQTSRNNVTGAGGSGADEDTGPVVTPAATAISYTGVGALATWAIGGYAIRPFGASGGAQTATPGVATVSVTGIAPAALGSGTATATPAVATVTVTAIAPATTGGGLTATPGVVTVNVSAVAPAASTPQLASPGFAAVAVQVINVAVSGGVQSTGKGSLMLMDVGA